MTLINNINWWVWAVQLVHTPCLGAKVECNCFWEVESGLPGDLLITPHCN
jgi:hypothetical protein